MEDFGFPIGSRVMLVKEDPCGYVTVGMIGVVCDIDQRDLYAYNCKIGVRWEEYKTNFHNCCGKCDDRHGRYVPPECLDLVIADLGEICVESDSVNTLFNTML